jgi:hypothetical protein
VEHFVVYLLQQVFLVTLVKVRDMIQVKVVVSFEDNDLGMSIFQAISVEEQCLHFRC